VERFIRTLLETWAYAYPCAQERARGSGLGARLDSYNRFRRDRALGGGRPTSCTGAPALEARLTATTDDFDRSLKRAESGFRLAPQIAPTRRSYSSRGASSSASGRLDCMASSSWG
jgi:hypothetical protein